MVGLNFCIVQKDSLTFKSESVFGWCLKTALSGSRLA